MSLPDPTVDLGWSDFAGSIQSHFQKNTLKHPQVLCVKETASSTTPERTFTYQQIYEASNLLAHYLHDAGITHGDVVMVYAFRGVELVPAIMGVLVRHSFFQRIFMRELLCRRITN
jgi:L-2-aminoadipate reductase